jgi:hypothetical protein
MQRRLEYRTLPAASAYQKYYQQRGGAGSSDKFGQIYRGQRFPQQQQQQGQGFGTFLGSIVRGISGLVNRTPSWVKSGAKILGQSALQGLSEYAGDVQAGADRKVARKRALQSTIANALEAGGKKLKGGGGKRRKMTRRRRRPQKGGAGRVTKKRVKKKKCCKLKMLRPQTGSGHRRQRRRKTATTTATKRRRRPTATIKRRSKFDLFSV